MTAVTITPSGPFSLEASLRFLEGFTSASYDDVGDRVLRLAFPADDGHSTVAAAVRQDEPAGDGVGTVRVEFAVHRIARILSLDVDGGGFPELAVADPVVAGLMADYAGLRPVAGIADHWKPYRSWVALLLCARADEKARVGAHRHRACPLCTRGRW
ncbi:hypothetical protein ACFHW2_41230 [Actinomadura sp. LOL_016]|uniref:hypothetical protein n=1 Tax=unclassified Actinomadura TaxID=2626254 RepID=UPI003A809F24